MELGADAPSIKHGVPRSRATARLVMVFLVKAEVVKPISSARRFDKGELPGVRNLSPYRLARGRTAVETSEIFQTILSESVGSFTV